MVSAPKGASINKGQSPYIKEYIMKNLISSASIMVVLAASSIAMAGAAYAGTDNQCVEVKVCWPK